MWGYGEPSPELDCGDGIDNNGDEAIDGEDPTCRCWREPSPELDCGDGIDNDGDDAIDTEDPDCGSTPPPPPSGEARLR